MRRILNPATDNPRPLRFDLFHPQPNTHNPASAQHPQLGHRPDTVPPELAHHPAPSVLAAGGPATVDEAVDPGLAPESSSPARMVVMFDHVVDKLHRRLDAESDADLARGMHYPTGWDPFFKDYMTLAGVYHFPTQRYDFHREQLTLD